MKQILIFFLICVTMIGCTSIPVFYGVMYSDNKVDVSIPQHSEIISYRV